VKARDSHATFPRWGAETSDVNVFALFAPCCDQVPSGTAGNGVSGLPDRRAERHPDSAAVPVQAVVRNARRFIRPIDEWVIDVSSVVEGTFRSSYARVVFIH